MRAICACPTCRTILPTLDSQVRHPRHHRLDLLAGLATHCPIWVEWCGLAMKTKAPLTPRQRLSRQGSKEQKRFGSKGWCPATMQQVGPTQARLEGGRSRQLSGEQNHSIHRAKPTIPCIQLHRERPMTPGTCHSLNLHFGACPSRHGPKWPLQ